MFSRRDLLQSGAALSAAGALPAAARAEAPAPMAFGRFVFSSRFAESRLLARRAAERGAALWETAGDMTGLWCDYLKAAWDSGPVPIAGVTTADGLFVLETLAADYRMRVIFRGEHAAGEAGEARHRLTGPETAIALARPGATGAWSGGVARAMAACTAGGPAAEATFAAPCADPSRTVPLYSWVIAAPRRSHRA